MNSPPSKTYLIPFSISFGGDWNDAWSHFRPSAHLSWPIRFGGCPNTITGITFQIHAIRLNRHDLRMRWRRRIEMLRLQYRIQEKRFVVEWIQVSQLGGGAVVRTTLNTVDVVGDCGRCWWHLHVCIGRKTIGRRCRCRLHCSRETIPCIFIVFVCIVGLCDDIRVCDVIRRGFHDRICLLVEEQWLSFAWRNRCDRLDGRRQSMVDVLFGQNNWTRFAHRLTAPRQCRRVRLLRTLFTMIHAWKLWKEELSGDFFAILPDMGTGKITKIQFYAFYFLVWLFASNICSTPSIRRFYLRANASKTT